MASLLNREVICIQGPTASGKSLLAEDICAALDGEVVSADSMQVYRGMDIGTAKVSASERGCAYHCLDLVEPGQAYSASLFQRDARRAIEDIDARGKRAVLCGGTGLYVRAVLDQMEFAAGVADRVIFMADGVIEEMGPPEEVFGNPKSEKTKAFLSAGTM